MVIYLRKTLISLLNKRNLDLFDEYFFNYNQQINEENARVSGTGYANIKLGYEEVIDTFSVTAFLTQKSFRHKRILFTFSNYYWF